MRKFLFSLLTLLLLGGTLAAQQTHFGVRVGVNATNASVDVNNGDVDVDGQTNLMLGAFVDLPIGGDLLSLQPEINYLNRGYGFGGFDYTLSYFDLGAILKLQFGDREATGFYLGVGPTLSYALSGQIGTPAGDIDVDFDGDRIKRGGLQFAGIGGASFNLSGLKAFVEARYNGSLTNISDSDDTDIRQNSIGANVGIMVPIGR